MHARSLENYIDFDKMFTTEMIDGQTYMFARPSKEHADIQGNIFAMFFNHFRQNKKKCVIRSEAELYIDEKNYVVPDLMVFCHNHSKDIPLIVIEILSKSTYIRDIGIKMKKYAGTGVKEYWIIDPKHRTVSVYVLNAKKEYDLYNVYVNYTDDDFNRIPELKELELKEIEIIKEFSPVSFPELKLKPEEIFYFVE